MVRSAILSITKLAGPIPSFYQATSFFYLPSSNNGTTIFGTIELVVLGKISNVAVMV